MTEKEKAKAYDNAIEKVKKLYGNGITEEIFPELNEDDTERIKKNCIHFLELQKQHHAATFEIEECIAWLEKQGKNSTDKPRFKVGDWIVFIKSGSIYQVEKTENYEYTLRYVLGGSLCLPFSNEELIRKWTIQDAKDGNVLVHSSFMFDDFIFIYNNTSILQAYCYYSNERNGLIIEDRGHHCPWNMQEVTPATKEQRDLLFQKIREAGYKWNDKTKTLEKLVKDKFDPKTLKSFDKVLAKIGTERYYTWFPDFVSFPPNDINDKIACIGKDVVSMAIPYNEETKHLIDTNEEAPEYYRYWEE